MYAWSAEREMKPNHQIKRNALQNSTEVSFSMKPFYFRRSLWGCYLPTTSLSRCFDLISSSLLVIKILTHNKLGTYWYHLKITEYVYGHVFCFALSEISSLKLSINLSNLKYAQVLTPTFQVNRFSSLYNHVFIYFRTTDILIKQLST